MNIVDAEGEVLAVQFNMVTIVLIRTERKYLEGAFSSIAYLVLVALDQGVCANDDEVRMIRHDYNAIRLLVKDPTFAFEHL